MDRGTWQFIVHGVTRVGHNLVTKPPPPPMLVNCWFFPWKHLQKIYIYIYLHKYLITLFEIL